MAPVRRSATPLPVETSEPRRPGRKLGQRPSAAVAAERKALGIKRHAEKATPEEIATEAGVALQTVKGWMRDKVAFPPHPPAPAAEPAPVDPRVELAAAMRAEGKSFGEIVKATGMTRGQLSWIMKQDRVRFPIKDRSAAMRAVAARRRSGVDQLAPDAAPRLTEVYETPVSVDAAPVSMPPKVDPVDAASHDVAQAGGSGDVEPIQAADDRPARDDAFRPLRGFEPVALVDAPSATCRWPVYPAGRSRFGVAFHCCGRATGDLKRSYCDVHARMSRGAGSSAERAAHKLPGRSIVASGGAKPAFTAEALR